MKTALAALLVVGAALVYLYEKMKGSPMENLPSPPSLAPPAAPSSLEDPRIAAIAAAIARAEGFGVAGSVPTRASNPGDLKLGDKVGLGTIGGGITVYAKADPDADISDQSDGYSALKREVRDILEGKSHVYSPGMSIAQIAAKWTATQPSIWATNVATALGVGTETPLGEVSA